jgi:hypothetical protein
MPPALRAAARAPTPPAEDRRAVALPPLREGYHTLSPVWGGTLATYPACPPDHPPRATESSRISPGPHEVCSRALRFAQSRLLCIPVTASRTGHVGPDTRWTPPTPGGHPRCTGSPPGRPPAQRAHDPAQGANKGDRAAPPIVPTLLAPALNPQTLLRSRPRGSVQCVLSVMLTHDG